MRGGSALKSHSLVTPFLSENRPPAARALPSGEKATEVTFPTCTRRVVRCCHLSTSQSCTAPAVLPVAKVLPSGEKARHRTKPDPSNVVSGRPVATSHTVTVASPFGPADTARSLPSEEN